MAHNRPLNIDDTAGKLNYKVQSTLSHAPAHDHHMNESLIGHEYGETSSEETYPSFDRSPGPQAKESSVTDRVEISQQQVSRTMAIALCGGFILFLAGYTMGKYQVKQNESSSQELIPSFVYSMFFEGAEPLVQAYERNFETVGNVGRFATLEEADKLCMNLKKEGKTATVVPQSSFTASGREFVQYQVVVPNETQVKVHAELAQESKAVQAHGDLQEDKEESESSEKKTMKKG